MNAERAESREKGNEEWGMTKGIENIEFGIQNFEGEFGIQNFEVEWGMRKGIVNQEF